VSKGVGEHHDEVGPDSMCRGGEGLTGVALPIAVRFGGGGSPVRVHRRGRGRSLHGRRGAPGQGAARGGEGEAGGGPEWPTRGGVPGDGRRRRPLITAL
jgi:hypothetical protein